MNVSVRLFVGVVCGLLVPLAAGCAGPIYNSDGMSEELNINDEHAAFARSHHLILRRFDLNRDKKTDVFKYYTRGERDLLVLARKEVDLNHDNTVDLVREYDDHQNVSKETVDLDFDGRMDEASFYKDGALVRKEVDLNMDGRPEVTKYYLKTQLKRVESDRDGDGKVDTWEFFEEGQLDRIGVDSDRDGQPDKWERKKK